MKHIYTSLDIGSDSIKIVVCELYQNKLNLLASSSVKSKGVKKGLITNVEEVASSIRHAIDDVEEILNISIDKVIVSVPSYATDYAVVKGEVEIKNENSIVSYDDIKEVLDVAIQSKKLDENELIAILPVDFKVDERKGLKDPINIHGNKLSVRAILVSTQKKYIYSVIGLLDSMGIETVDISTNGIGDIHAFMSKDIESSVGCYNQHWE